MCFTLVVAFPEEAFCFGDNADRERVGKPKFAKLTLIAVDVTKGQFVIYSKSGFYSEIKSIPIYALSKCNASCDSEVKGNFLSIIRRDNEIGLAPSRQINQCAVQKNQPPSQVTPQTPTAQTEILV